MENQDIRWKQRFSNYKDALIFLKESVAKEDHSELEKAGVIQSFVRRPADRTCLENDERLLK
jgi:hypothetical protein